MHVMVPVIRGRSVVRRPGGDERNGQSSALGKISGRSHVLMSSVSVLVPVVNVSWIHSKSCFFQTQTY